MTGKTCAGLWVTGTGKDGQPRSTYLYHVVDNEWAMHEYGHQCVVWQTAINPVVALELLARGTWSGPGVLGPEAFDAVPFLDLLTEYGSPWGQVREVARSPGSSARDPASSRKRRLAGGRAVGRRAGVRAGDRVHHHLVDAVRRRELAHLRGRRLGGVPTTQRSSMPVGQGLVLGWDRSLLGLLDEQLGRAVAARCAARPSPAGWAATSRSASSAVSATTALTVRKVRGSGWSVAGLVVVAVERERLGGAAAGEVVREHVGQPLLGGEPGRVVRRAEQPHRGGARGARGWPERVRCRPTRSPTPPGDIIAMMLSTYSGKRSTASASTPPAP